MIEILFGESEAGSMKAAKNTVIIGGKMDGPTAIWMAGKKKPPERENAGWIEGTPDEVICLGFLLDIGDIREEVDSRYRKELIYSMYAQNQFGKNTDGDAEMRRLGDCYCHELDRLREYLEEGETVRIWYSDAPYSICGFYYLCTILRKYENEIRVVKLPKYKVQSNTITSYQNWGEIAAEEFAGFLSYEKILSQNEVRMGAAIWNELREDNSPLRAVVNGRVLGVLEDFYDFLIWKEIGEKPIKEARLIGNILGRNPISVGDWWYARRIEYFIRIGKINVAEDCQRKYARIICRA